MAGGEKCVRIRWSGDMPLEAENARGTASSIDENGRLAPSPTDLLLEAVAGCTAIDVVEILRKGRQPIEGLEVEVSGERRAEPPRRYTRLRLVYRITGEVDRARAERAVSLSLDKYCSVFHSLSPDLREGADVTIEIESAG